MFASSSLPRGGRSGRARRTGCGRAGARRGCARKGAFSRRSGRGARPAAGSGSFEFLFSGSGLGSGFRVENEIEIGEDASHRAVGASSCRKTTERRRSDDGQHPVGRAASRLFFSRSFGGYVRLFWRLLWRSIVLAGRYVVSAAVVGLAACVVFGGCTSRVVSVVSAAVVGLAACVVFGGCASRAVSIGGCLCYIVRSRWSVCLVVSTLSSPRSPWTSSVSSSSPDWSVSHDATSAAQSGTPSTCPVAK